jgi:hypothetical protein
MHKFINVRPFMQSLFDDQTAANQAAEIGQAILAARSLRLTEIAVKMRGSSEASYKRIQRLVKQADPRQVLWRLFQEQAEFVIGDPTEIERPQAWKTDYVGTLKDGKTKGFWAMVLATAYRGRAIPCGLITYSSKTIAAGLDSRNLNHFRAFAELKDLLGERPLVLDREFSYLELLLNLAQEQVNFVIRLNLGSHPPKFWDADGQEVALTISPGETIVHNRVWYKGQACVNLIGTWGKGFSEPRPAGSPVWRAARGAGGGRRTRAPAGSSTPKNGQEVEALFRLVHLAQAEMVAFVQGVAGNRRDCFGLLPGHCSAPCPNSCLNFRNQNHLSMTGPVRVLI